MSKHDSLRLILASALLLLAASTPQSLSATPLRTQAMNVPVCTVPGDQLAPRIVPDDRGGAFVVWADERSGNTDVYVQHVLNSGAMDTEWPVDGRAVCAAGGIHAAGSLVSDGTGGAIVTWEDSRDGTYQIYAQHLLAAGVVDPNWPPDGLALCVTTSDQRAPAIDADGAGGAIIAWEDGRNGVDQDVYAQHVLSFGVVDPAWAPEGVPIATGTDNGGGQLNERVPRVVSDHIGGAMIFFMKNYLTFPWAGGATTAQHVLATGVLDSSWPLEGVVFGGSRSAVASDGAGGAYVANATEIIAGCVTVDHLLPSGDQAWNQPHVVLSAHRESNWDWPAIGSDGAKGAAVSATEVHDVRVNDPPYYEDPNTIYASYTTGAGYSLPPLAVGGCAGHSIVPEIRSAVAADGAGGAIVAWESRGSGTTMQVYAQHMLSSGQPDPDCPGNGPVNPETSQCAPDMVSDGAGGAILVWQDGGTGAGSDIYSLRLLAPHPTPVLVALVSTNVTAESVQLEWSCTGGAGLNASIDRSSGDEAWRRLGMATADGDGRLRFEDRAVDAGTRYGYRLAIPDGARETLVGETWVQVPVAPTLTLEGARPNPGAGVLKASFTLPVARPATLELLDIFGRSIASREVGALGAGPHVVDLTQGQLMVPGIYLLRLTQAGRSHHARCVVLR